MNIARTICPLGRRNIGRNFYRKFRFSSTNYESSEASIPQIKEEKFEFEDLKVFERTERRKPPIEPFMKNVFVSKFNRDLLAYPEILNKEETESLNERINRLENTFTDSTKNETDRYNILKQASMFAAIAKLTDNGLAMNVTERLRYLETVSNDLKLSKQLSDHWVGLDALRLGLNTEEYEKLLPNLINGDNNITVCARETISTRISQADFRTTAKFDGKGSWIINGEKECHSIGSYILVLCALEASRLQAFLVSPKADGIKFEEPIITFRDVQGIPLDNASEADLAKVLALSRLDTATLTHSTLKHAILACIDYVRGRFVSGKPLADISTIRLRVGEAMLTLYAAESAAYFTAGLLDGYENPDAELEMAMCRNFIVQHGVQAMLKLQSIPGLQQDESFQARMESMRRLAFDENHDNVNMFIALNGIQYAAKFMAEEIKQIRNPLFHPKFILKKVFTDRHQEADNPKLTLHLEEHLHPTLKAPSELLEYSVLRMRFACEAIMSRHGAELGSAYTELERLAQAGAEILAMTAVLSRASRSYCIGVRNAEVEMRLAACFVERSRDRVQRLIKEINDGEYLNLDHYKIDFGRKILDASSTIVETPITRVFW